MAEFGDVAKEFHGAKPQTKVMLAVGGIAVLGVVWYLHSQSGGGASTPVQMPGQGYSGGSGGGGGIQTVPTGAEGGGVPLLPGGFIPLFDPSGQLIGYQPTQTTTTPAPTPTPTPTPTPKPKPGGKGTTPPDKDRGHRVTGRDDRKTHGAFVPAKQSGVTPRPGPGGIHSIPMQRPQRANPSLQRTQVTRTAARTRTT